MLANQQTRKEQRELAIQLLKKLDIYKPYIKGFKDDDLICFFENYGGYWTFQEPKIQNKIQELEEKGVMVYAVTHEFTEFGELYDFLIIPSNKEDWDDLVTLSDDIHKFYAFAYVWNVDDDCCSEYGTITVKSLYGGLKQIA